MRYDFIKVFCEQLGDMNYEQYREIAYSMIQYGKENLGNGRFSKYFYNSIIDAMKALNKKYGKNHILPSEDDELKEELRWKKEVGKEQCIFLTFLIMTMRKKEREKGKVQATEEDCCVDSYKREYVGILNTFYKANGIEVLINSSMDNAILYFSLATQQPWERWVDMQAEWNRYRDNDDDWHRKHREWRSLNYSEFKERVREGLSENTATTQNTYLEADRTIAEIIDDYNKEKCVGNMLEAKVCDVFPADIQKVMENAEWRRMWYLYRMISMVIDYQIETIIKNVKKMKASHNKRDEERLMLAVDTCWLRTNYVKIQKKISSAADDEEMEKLLRDYLNSCPLTVENIAHVFNESLGGYGEIVFVQAKYRFSCHFSELMEEYLNDPKKRAHYWIIHEYFKSDKDVKNILRNELTGSERNARLFYKVMSGEIVTSREMLLLTALVVKKQGSPEMDRDYVYNHILKNCRFDLVLHEDRPFDSFFLESFSHIDRLHDNAMKLEKDMLVMGRGAVFYNIIRGKEV